MALVCLAALSFSGDAATQPRLPESPADSAAPLPDKLPGGQIVTTDGVVELSHRNIPVHFIDVSGETKTLPKTISAPWLVRLTNPNSDTLGQLDDFLYRVTRQNKLAPVTFFGSGPQSRGAAKRMTSSALPTASSTPAPATSTASTKVTTRRNPTATLQSSKRKLSATIKAA